MKREIQPSETYIEATRIGNWFRDHGVRETIESILIAILLALLFRAFEAEAFIIPTGSMASNLQGRHIDVACERCGFQYRAGASSENPTNRRIINVERVVCPICQYRMTLKRPVRRDHRSFPGDRILVNKFAYDFADPERYDVIVFKYPNNAKQNFIKRLIGLPGESVLIETGDIFTFNNASETFADRRIARKSPRKLLAMLELVDDTDYIAQKLIDAGWPSRWSQWRDGKIGWNIDYTGTRPTFSVDATSENSTLWIRYRHLRPRPSEWDQLNRGQLPERMKGEAPLGELIPDYYAYNEFQVSRESFRNYSGLHWVGDLAMRFDVEIQSDSGSLQLDLVEGGVHFLCTIDVATGEATLSFDAGDTDVSFVDESGNPSTKAPSAKTPISGGGKHQIMFANADDKLYLWVDGRHIEFETSAYARQGRVEPAWSVTDAGDAEPLGIGVSKGVARITRIEVLRDIYYTSKNREQDQKASPPRYAEPRLEYFGSWSRDTIMQILQNPQTWDGARAKQLFQSRYRDADYVFALSNEQLLPMGDNSPESSDARVWNGPSYVDRSYLLGKALLIYWPHAKTKPLPFFPNFERMGLIR